MLTIVLSALVALLCVSSALCEVPLSPEEAHRTIRDHLATRYPPVTSATSLCEKNDCCTVSADEPCPLSSFPQDSSVLVLPGGETRCIFSFSTPFAFQVIRGDADKLLFYFQGGGACWDKTTTVDAPLCSTDVSPQSPVGVFDRENPQNRFRNYTIVHVLYCSGDVHGGDVTQSYADKQGVPVQQKGLANARSALDWVRKQQQSSGGALSGTLSELVVMGCSAGSLGAQLWSKEVLQSLRWRTAAVVPDSYAGVFPPNTVGPLMHSYGFCSSGFLSPRLYAQCVDDSLSLEELNVEFMRAFASVPFAFVQSKTDIVQQSFYVSVALSMNATQKSITPSQFYTDVNVIFSRYNNDLEARNFVTYLVNGDQHCFTDQALYYTADPVGAKDNGAKSDSPMMAQWLNALPLRDGESENTVCDGALQGGAAALPDNTYCSSKIDPKTFVEKY